MSEKWRIEANGPDRLGMSGEFSTKEDVDYLIRLLELMKERLPRKAEEEK